MAQNLRIDRTSIEVRVFAVLVHLPRAIRLNDAALLLLVEHCMIFVEEPCRVKHFGRAKLAGFIKPGGVSYVISRLRGVKVEAVGVAWFDFNLRFVEL